MQTRRLTLKKRPVRVLSEKAPFQVYNTSVKQDLSTSLSSQIQENRGRAKANDNSQIA